MAQLLKRQSWSPYVVGAAIGMLSWFAFWSADHPLGITTAFEHTAALAGVGVLGMLFGAGLFVALYPLLRPIMTALGDMGEITVPQALGVSPWVIIAALVIAGVIALIVQQRGKRPGAGWSLPPVGSRKHPKVSA